MRATKAAEKLLELRAAADIERCDTFTLPPEAADIPRWIPRTSYCDRDEAMTRVGRMIATMRSVASSMT